MTQNNCPICGRETKLTTQNEIYNLGDCQVIQCIDCTHIYTFFDEEISLEELYEDSRYKVVDNRDSLFDKILRLEYGKVLKMIGRLVNEPVSLLDFGCGKGKFLSLAAEKGWTVKGIETSVPRAEFAKEKYSLDVETDYYSDGEINKGPFKVISLFHVVEHLGNPKEILHNLIRHNLVKNGLLIIEVPNFNSWQSKWAGKDWLQLDVPRHINHFTTQSLQSLVFSLGLKTTKTSYFSFHVGLLGMLNTCLRLLGYKEDLIFTLKNKKNLRLYVLMALTLPFATILEILSSFVGRGGIIRLYAIRK